MTNSAAHFVSAIVVHHVGHGGVYFWGGVTKRRDQGELRLLPKDFLMETGETRTMINEIVGMVKGSGFLCKTKPDSFGASNVADRHT